MKVCVREAVRLQLSPFIFLGAVHPRAPGYHVSQDRAYKGRFQPCCSFPSVLLLPSLPFYTHHTFDCTGTFKPALQPIQPVALKKSSQAGVWINRPKPIKKIPPASPSPSLQATTYNQHYCVNTRRTIGSANCPDCPSRSEILKLMPI